MSTDAQPAAPSAAPVETPDLSALSPDALTQWRTTGFSFPTEQKTETPPAESSPAEPAEQVAEIAASPAPASEPGKSSQKANAETRKPQLETDIQSLLARRHALKEEIAQLERHRQPTEPQTPPAASSPASATPTLTDTLQRPDISKAPLSEAEFFAAFEGAAYGDYTRYISRYELAYDRAQTAEAQRREQQGQALVSRRTAFNERIAKGREADPDFQPDPRINQLRPLDVLGPQEVPTSLNVIGQEIFTSPLAHEVIKYLTANPAELDRLAAMTTHAEIVRAFGKLEAKLETPATVPPPTKTTSSAPPPPSTLGRKPALPADAVESAVASGDFGRYRDEMNRRELAAR